MIVDSSAIVAIMQEEPEAAAFEAAIIADGGAKLSAASYVESGIVIDSARSPVLSERLDQLIAELGISIVPVSASQALIARAAYQRFGKGNGHPARLNFGDCLSYALAIDRNEPMLFKGDDFIHTDVQQASA